MTRLGDMLLKAELIDKFQLESGLSLQRNVGGRIGSALVKLGYIAEETILQFLDEQGEFERIDLQAKTISSEVLTAIPVAKLFETMVLPIEWTTQGKSRVLVVAMTDPTNLKLIDDLQFMADCRVKAVVASENDIAKALKRYFPTQHAHPTEAEAQSENGTEALPIFSESWGNKGERVEHRLDRLIALLLRKGVLSDRDVDSLN